MEVLEKYEYGRETVAVRKAAMVLTDYTEHDLLPFQDAVGRPKGQACIIATLWDEHCTTAQNKDIKAGDLVYLRNLLPKVGPNGTIELNMNGYRDRGYREMHPVQKLEPNDSALKELQTRKAKYEQHLITLEEEEEEDKRTRQNIIQTNQDVEAASSESLPEPRLTRTLRSIELELGDDSNQPLPPPQFSPHLRLIKMESGSVTTQPSSPPHSSPTLTPIKLEPGSVSDQSPPPPQPTPTPGPTNFPGLGQSLGRVFDQPQPQLQPIPTYKTKSTALPEPAPSLPHKVPTTPTTTLSVEASSNTASADLAVMSTTRSPQDIQPDVDTPIK
ncbi:hypothetical protein BGZ47_000137, partial [Haplosporangium gracile]